MKQRGILLRLLPCALVMAAVSLWISPSVGSVVVAPTSVYVDAETGTAELTLLNPSNVPEEVTLEAIFGFPTTDEEGRLHLWVDHGGGDPRSAAEWVRAFPQRLVVEPNQRQRVRILVDAPEELPPGEYWSRLVISSRGLRADVDGAQGARGVQVGVDLEVRTIIALIYRKGQVSTGVEVHELSPVLTGDSLIFRPRFERVGQGAYIGRLEVRLEDGAGLEAGSWTEEIAAYRTYHRRFAYGIEELPPGEYTLRLELSTGREDVPGRFRLPTAPVEVRAPVVRR